MGADYGTNKPHKCMSYYDAEKNGHLATCKTFARENFTTWIFCHVKILPLKKFCLIKILPHEYYVTWKHIHVIFTLNYLFLLLQTIKWIIINSINKNLLQDYGTCQYRIDLIIFLSRVLGRRTHLPNKFLEIWLSYEAIFSASHGWTWPAFSILHCQNYMRQLSPLQFVCKCINFFGFANI